MTRRILVALFTVLLLPGAAGAQTRPDLSGTWTLPGGGGGGAGKPAPAPGYGAQINIEQTATAVTISRIIGGAVVHVTHPLDRTESRSVRAGGLCRGDLQSFWTAEWQGDTLVTVMTGSLPAGAATPTKTQVRASFRMPSPDTLLVETPVRSGTAAPEIRSTRYVRTGPPVPVPSPQAAAPVPARITQLDWLAGTWVGSADTGTAEERWTPPAAGSMFAVARTLSGGALASFEFLCIVERRGGLVYQAMPNGRQPATDFTLTKIAPRGATFENATNSFPKMIRYSLAPDGTLEAVISDADQQKAETFRFKKQ